ncbi:MAG: hypothetical protein IT548_16360 [Alphaproteobacteria bacterium]|nr:hypothetical protein [Alphaproteobacteria bacterium]
MSALRLIRRLARRLGLAKRLPPQPAAFDSVWYRRQAGRTANPWHHYLATGWRAGFAPSPLFDSQRYLRLYPDVARAGIEPLTHYLTDGWREGRSPHALFDAAWYAAQRAAIRIDPLTDYLREGWQAGCSPHPLIDVAFLRSQDKVAPTRSDLEAYLDVGWQAGRDPHPYFSLAHYRQSNPDLCPPEVEPLSHYAGGAYRNAVSTHPDFDAAFYRRTYLSTRRDPPDPLADFVVSGWILERRPRADAPPDWRETVFARLFRGRYSP